jgi:hypothetical protein
MRELERMGASSGKGVMVGGVVGRQLGQDVELSGGFGGQDHLLG